MNVQFPTAEMDIAKREFLEATLCKDYSQRKINYRKWKGELSDGYHVIEFYRTEKGHDSILYITCRKWVEEVEFYERHEYWLTLPEGKEVPLKDQEFTRFKILFPVGEVSKLVNLCREQGERRYPTDESPLL